MLKNRPRIAIFAILVFFCGNALFAQKNAKNTPYPSTEFVSKVKMSAEKLIFQFEETYTNFTVEISGPKKFYLKKEFKNVQDITIESIGLEEKPFIDGQYTVQITPNFHLSEKDQKIMRYYMASDEQEKLAALKEINNIPNVISKYDRNFKIKDGTFILPKYESAGLKLPTDNARFGSEKLLKLKPKAERPVFASHLPIFNQPLPTFVDQQILDDLIVDGSLCVGFDCVNGESFGFDTVKMKENNVRIKADDTSNSASFPQNDWQLTFNETDNGGKNKFSVDDVTGGRTPFTIEAATPSHSLYLKSSGQIGLGTSTPAVQLHQVDGNTPTLRLEQDGSSGFGAQTWDMAGNEANFFIRDATNGSALAFRIFPGSGTNNALNIASNGYIGMGTTSPTDALHIFRAGSANHAILRLESTNGLPRIEFENGESASTWIADVSDNDDFRISVNGSGQQELQISNSGNVSITGTLTTAGPTCSAGCDLVFQPDVYTIPSIEEHAAFMWRNSYLKNVGPTPEGAPINVTEKVGGILNELEHAHIYIEQLNNQIKSQKEKIENLEVQVVRMESLEKRVAELANLIQKAQNMESNAVDSIKE